MYSEALIRSIRIAAKQSYPNEMCGFVLQDGSFVKCNNISNKPMEHFEISPIDIHKYIADAKYIVHSHTRKKFLHICTPSLADIECQERWNIPFLIVGYDGCIFTEPMRLPTLRNNSFLNRPYIYGIYDCGVLLRDYYFFTFGIELVFDPRNSIRPKKDWAEAVRTSLENNNFTVQDIKVQDAQHGDVLIVSTMGGIANHAITYINKGTVLNQSEFSTFEPLADWADDIIAIYRHGELC